MDCIELNDYTIRDRYPIPNIKDLIDDMQGSKIFDCLDLQSVYWHIPVEESSVEKTAFEIPKGKYEMLRTPF